MNAPSKAIAVFLAALIAGPLLAAEPPSDAEVEKALAAVADYGPEKPRQPLHRIEELIRAATDRPKLKAKLRNELVKRLGQQMSHDARLFVCQKLWILGPGKDGTAALEKMLLDDATAHMACYALGREPSEQADQVLRDALRKAKGTALLTIVNHIGERRDTQSVDAIAKLTASKDATLAAAALTSLGKIGGQEAAQRLKQARGQVSKKLKDVTENALLQCAQRLADGGETAAAAGIYRELRGDSEARHVRRGALLGLIQVSGPEAVPLIIATLRGNDPMMKAAAVASIRRLAGEGISQRFAAELPKCPSHVQALLINALVARGDAQARPAVEAMTRADDAAVRIAALKGLGQIGDVSSVPALVRGIEGASQEEAEAALNSLRRLDGEGVDAAIIGAMRAEGGLVCGALIEVLHDREVTDAVPAILEKAAGKDANAREAAFRGLSRLAGPKHVPRLVTLLVGLEGDAGRKAAELAVAAVARKIEEPTQQANAVLAALRDAKTPAARASLLRVLRGIGTPGAFQAVKGALDADDPTVRDAAIRALAGWPDARAVDALLGIVRSAEDKTHRVVALRGAVRLLTEAAELPVEEKLAAYANAMQHARGPAEKKLILSGVSRCPGAEAFNIVKSCLGDPAVSAEAELALVAVARRLAGAEGQAVKAALREFMASSKNNELRKEAAQIVRQVDTLGDYLAAWQVAGPYQKTGASGEQLFDVPFPPEQPEADAEWRPLPLGPDPRRPWLFDLQQALGGEQRVGYARTWVHVGAPQKARLEVGSDDGNKAWLNGKVVLANNVGGACKPGQYKANVTLRQGWNALLLKITQLTGPWQFCARLATPDGEPLKGLKVRATPPGKKK